MEYGKGRSEIPAWPHLNINLGIPLITIMSGAANYMIEDI
jgi:hypothetical protein